MRFNFIACLLISFAIVTAPVTRAAETAPAENPRRSAPVNTGDVAPDFTLEDQDGHRISLSAEWKKQFVLLVFYRGYWCPYCTRQFAEWRPLLKPNEKVRLLAVSVDTAEQSRGFSEKIAADGKGPITFTMLSDPGHRIIDLYGLQDPQYLKLKQEGIPYPTTYLIDKTGRVAWTRIDRNYRERPPLGEIRALLDKLP